VEVLNGRSTEGERPATRLVVEGKGLKAARITTRGRPDLFELRRASR
jgi:hypothetical protein